MRAGDNTKRIQSTNKLLNNLLYKILILILTINISCAIIPSGSISSYGLFGEVTSISSIENQLSSIQSNPIKNNIKLSAKALINKEQQILQYAYLLLIITVVFIRYVQYGYAFPIITTPVVMKVRLNH